MPSADARKASLAARRAWSLVEKMALWLPASKASTISPARWRNAATSAAVLKPGSTRKPSAWYRNCWAGLSIGR